MLDTIIEIISRQLGVEPSEIDGNTRIVDDLGADSLDIVEMVMAIEQECGVTIPDEDIMGLQTVGDVASYVENNK